MLHIYIRTFFLSYDAFVLIRIKMVTILSFATKKSRDTIPISYLSHIPIHQIQDLLKDSAFKYI